MSEQTFRVVGFEGGKRHIQIGRSGWTLCQRPFHNWSRQRSMLVELKAEPNCLQCMREMRRLVEPVSYVRES